MARPRTRFCPYGHDKDAVDGSRWGWGFSLKGTRVALRECRLCAKTRSKNWKDKLRLERTVKNNGKTDRREREGTTSTGGTTNERRAD